MEETKTQKEGLKEETKDLADHVGDYLETYYQLITIKIAQKVINGASAAINAVIIGLLGLFFFSFISLGLAWGIGNLVNSRAGGFFIMGGFYLMILLIIVAMRKKTIAPFLRNFLTKKIYE